MDNSLIRCLCLGYVLFAGASSAYLVRSRCMPQWYEDVKACVVNNFGAFKRVFGVGGGIPRLRLILRLLEFVTRQFRSLSISKLQLHVRKPHFEELHAK